MLGADAGPGVYVADEVDGGGVGLLRRPLVKERKAPKRAAEDERRSGVRGPSSPDGGDIGLVSVVCLMGRWLLSYLATTMDPAAAAEGHFWASVHGRVRRGSEVVREEAHRFTVVVVVVVVVVVQKKSTCTGVFSRAVGDEMK